MAIATNASAVGSEPTRSQAVSNAATATGACPGSAAKLLGCQPSPEVPVPRGKRLAAPKSSSAEIGGRSGTGGKATAPGTWPGAAQGPASHSAMTNSACCCASAGWE
eukprot:3637928-Lingulodinium_polyedra.AAC.1